jgi:hypothetical protein
MFSMIKVISDQYRKNRGGWTRFLKISCNECGQFLFFYQKDGPGPLKRSYLDRIIGKKPTYDKRGFWHCSECDVCLGFYEPYIKENNRPAIRWATQAVNYKTIRQSFLRF